REVVGVAEVGAQLEREVVDVDGDVVGRHVALAVADVDGVGRRRDGRGDRVEDGGVAEAVGGGPVPRVVAVAAHRGRGQLGRAAGVDAHGLAGVDLQDVPALQADVVAAELAGDLVLDVAAGAAGDEVLADALRRAGLARLAVRGDAGVGVGA